MTDHLAGKRGTDTAAQAADVVPLSTVRTLAHEVSRLFPDHPEVKAGHAVRVAITLVRAAELCSEGSDHLAGKGGSDMDGLIARLRAAEFDQWCTEKDAGYR